MISGVVSIVTNNITGRVEENAPVNGSIRPGSGGFLGHTRILQKTTAEWNSEVTLISDKDTIYVYTDYQNKDGVNVPGVKIGDGNAYVIDLPFIFGLTQADIESWNNKIAVRIDDYDAENLIMYT